MAVRVQRRQFAAYVFASYAAAAWAIIGTVQESLSFLELSARLCEGLNLILLCNFAAVNGVLLWKALTHLLFGELRLLEYEHIFERLSFTIVNCFFMSSAFSESEFMSVMAFSAALIFVKVFHWVLRDRLEHVFQHTDEHTNFARLLLSRFFFNIFLLGFLDFQMTKFCIQGTRFFSRSGFYSSSLSVHLMFAVEFAMLLVDVTEVAMKSIINLVEVYQCKRSFARDGEDYTGLEGKFMYEKVVQLICQLTRMGLHIMLMMPFSMPLMIAKDILWDAFAVFHTAKSLLLTWKSNRQIDEKLPDVSEAQLAASDDKMCIVCMDDMLAPSECTNAKQKPKRLPCNHCLHLGCLKSWMERSQTCPICRVPVFDKKGNVVVTSDQTNNQPGTSSAVESTADETSTAATTSVSSQSSSIAVTDVPSHQRGWYAFPTVQVHDEGSIDIKVTDTSGAEIKATLVCKDRHEFEAIETDAQGPRKVVVKNDCVYQNQDIERLKRRISELENKVDELSKKARTE